MGKFLVTYRDYGQPGERSTVTFPINDVNDVNYAALSTQVDTLRQAMDGITLGTFVRRMLVANENVFADVPPASPFAQRETKWVIRYHQDIANGPTHYLEIPTADLQYLDPAANDKALMTDPAIVAFIAAFEAVVKQDGNDVVVDEVLFVGRKT